MFNLFKGKKESYFLELDDNNDGQSNSQVATATEPKESTPKSEPEETSQTEPAPEASTEAKDATPATPAPEAPEANAEAEAEVTPKKKASKAKKKSAPAKAKKGATEQSAPQPVVQDSLQLIRAAVSKNNSNGASAASGQSAQTFAPDNLMPLRMSKRRPGASMAMYKDMARKVKTPRN